MADGKVFIYNILRVNRNCSAQALDAAYRYLAKMYHPDHVETADVTKFNEVLVAYRALRNPDQRAEYDILYAAHANEAGYAFPLDQEDETDGKAAVDDAEAHARILLVLYKRRREHALDPGVPVYSLQEMLNCSDEHFEFHRWYLKAKGFVELTEQGTMAITLLGVDHVISMSRTTMREKLLIAQSGNLDD
jgi:curved DNA-binding protein